jgi:hypothetical protein
MTDMLRQRPQHPPHAEPGEPDPYADTVAQIEAAALPAPVYRTARRLLDLAAPHHGDIVLDRTDALHIVGGADGTMRSHLVQLARAGIINYHTNHFVSVRFPAWGEPGDNSADDNHSRAERSDTRAERASPPHPPRAERAPTRARRSQLFTRALSARSRAVSARPRALGDQIAPPINECNGMNGIPTTQADHSFIHTPPTPPGADTDPDKKTAAEILVDVGVDAGMAVRLAAAAPLTEIVRQVAAWLPRHATGSVQHGALVRRIFQRAPAPELTADFRASQLYRRHFPEADDSHHEEAERRRRYLPDEYSDIVIG